MIYSFRCGPWVKNAWNSQTFQGAIRLLDKNCQRDYMFAYHHSQYYSDWPINSLLIKRFTVWTVFATHYDSNFKQNKPI